MTRLMRWHMALVLLLPVALLMSCKTDNATSGSSVLDEDDAIIVCSDTFALTSSLRECRYVISSPDSFMLGEMETKFGTLHADVLTQLSCPEGFCYPENAEIDSVCFFLYYRSWVGDARSPLAINVYEMDGEQLVYNPRPAYHTDIDLSQYWSGDESTAILKDQRIVVANRKTDSVYSAALGTYVPVVAFRLSDAFRDAFTAKRQYTTQEDFNQFFKGLYVTSDFGGSTILNVTDMSLGVYYHFSYTKGDRDTVVNDMKAFYSNSEVKQVNRFEYVDKTGLVEELRKDSATHNYIIAPACVYTMIQLPMRQMAQSIEQQLGGKESEGGKRPYINLAQLRVDVLNVYEGANADRGRDDWLQPAKQMLLIKNSSMERFFEGKELPVDTVAILGELTKALDEHGENIYYYTFDISTLLTNQLRQQSNDSIIDMTLTPVDVLTNYNSTYGVDNVVAIKESQNISATVVRSAQNAESPMTLKVVYSGF